MNITFNYQYDIPNLIKKQISLDFKNYRKKFNSTFDLLNSYKKDYSTKEYGNILYSIKSEDILKNQWKYQYLSSLEIFDNNNYHYYPYLINVDMHGLRVNEMINILDILFDYWAINKIKKIKIITGNGNKILHKALIKYLKEWHIKYNDFFSYINICINQ